MLGPALWSWFKYVLLFSTKGLDLAKLGCSKPSLTYTHTFTPTNTRYQINEMPSDTSITYTVVFHGAVHSAASSNAAMRMVAGSCPVLVTAWEWHIGLVLLYGCSGALQYPTANSCEPINKSLSLSLSLPRILKHCSPPVESVSDEQSEIYIPITLFIVISAIC